MIKIISAKYSFFIYMTLGKILAVIPAPRFLPCIFVFVFKNNFLDYYVAYLRDLPECISLVHVVVLKEVMVTLCVHCPLVTCVSIGICSSTLGNAKCSACLPGWGMARRQSWTLLPGVKGAHSRMSASALVLALLY